MTREESGDSREEIGGGIRRRQVLETLAAGGILGATGLATRHGLTHGAGSAVATSGCDLAVTKAQDCELDYGENGTFTIQVCNVGGAECTEPVTVVDDLPDGLSYVDGDGTGWSVTESGGTVTFEHPNDHGLGPGTCLPTITLEVSVAPESEWPEGTVENCAEVSADDDGNPDNDGDCAVVCIEDIRTFEGGRDDDFETDDGPESTTTSQGLQDRIDSYGPQREFDEGGINAAFGHSFLDLFPDENLGDICEATLEIRMRPEGSSLDYNDRLVLGFFGTSAPKWGRYIGAGNGKPGLLDFKWDTSNTDGETIVLDLDALPLADGGTQSLLASMNDRGYLDVFVQDDTAVDFVRLDVEYCCDDASGDCDLVVEKAADEPFTAGGSGSYTVTVCNVGDSECDGGVTVTDDLPDGLSFDSASGTNWSVSASGGTVTATHPDSVPPGSCLPELTIDVFVDEVADLPDVEAIDNCAVVDGEDDDNDDNDAHCVTVDCLEGTVVDTGGVEDDFDTSDGTEYAEPSPALADWIDQNYGPRREFDEDVGNAAFGHTFDDLHRHPLLGEICGATLEIRMKPVGTSLDYNDRLSLRFVEDGGPKWARYIGSGNGKPGLLDYEWNTSNTSGETIVLDLGALPEADGTTTSFIDELDDLGYLDVYVQDDTAVDYARLEVEYCCGDEPTGQCDLTVEKVAVDDFHFGETGQYEIRVCNEGDGECIGEVNILDSLPDEVSFVSASGTGWSASASGGTVTATHDGPVPAGDCLPPLTIDVDVEEGDEEIDVENCVDVVFGEETVASDCLTHTITPRPTECDLAIYKEAVGEFAPGSVAEYVITVCNEGDGECEEPVYVTDRVPDGIYPVGVDGNGWQGAISGQHVEASHDNPGLAPGDCLPELYVEVEVGDDDEFEELPTEVRNCARIEEPSDADDSNDVDCVTHEVG